MTFLSLNRFVRTATKSSMTLNQCPAVMGAATPSFAQGSVWKIILHCVIKLGKSQHTFSLLFLQAFVRLTEFILLQE
jgi:hypothetical protein